MADRVSPRADPAIVCDGISAAELATDGKSAVDDSGWFSDVARSLLPTKAGTALHYITGFDERLCQRYAAGHVEPRAYFLRTLLRSEQGWQFLAATMDGCKAQWWRELVVAKTCAEFYEHKRRELDAERS